MANSTTNGVSAEKLASEVMKARQSHGDEWQDYIADKFEEMGIQPTFFTINDGLSDRIADYQYEGNWIEAKTFLTQSDVTKILRLSEILQKRNIRMIVMCEWNPKEKKQSKNVRDLRNNGVIVFEGQSECDSFIINESVTLNPSKEIKMAEPKLISFDRIIPHPDNRDLNVKNIPTIKVSICKNGFFTQINVVPLGMNDKAKRNIPINEDWYMIFEGHTRYFALKDLIEKGYIVNQVACINVPWISSDDIDLLHKILITTNTTYQSWKLRNYVKSHKGNFERLGDFAGIYSYGIMLKAMSRAKKEKWGEANPVYIFCHKTSLDFNDMKSIKNGEYRITQAEYEEEIEPILEMVSEITKDGRQYNGTILRDITVDCRILYNTDPSIKQNWKLFLGFLAVKFKSSYDSGTFPETKETGQKFWSVIKGEYIGLKNLGLVNATPYQPSKTIHDFVS